MKKNECINIFLSIILAFIIGAIIIAVMGFNPMNTYVELFKGAFAGKFNFGGTLEKFVPLLLTAVAFAVSAKVSMFNCGVEGELYLGAIVAAFLGYRITGLPTVLHVTICLLAAAIVGGLWALIPAALKAYYRVNEICTTILLNYVAIDFCSYLVNHPLSAKQGVARTKDIMKTAELKKIMLPSRANIGLFIAIAVVFLIYWFLYHTTKGYEIRNVGINPDFSEYIGIKSKRTMMLGMFLSGALGGLAGAIEVMGIYGYFLDNFSDGIANNGMLAALIAGSNIKVIPFISFFLAILQTGALGMQQFTGVAKSIIDAIIALFILIATMKELFNFKKKHSSYKKLEKTVSIDK